MVNHVLPKAQNFVYFVPCDFVHISPACGSNTYQTMYEETSNVSVSNGYLKYPIGKSIFAVNLFLKLFRATVANANTAGLKSLPKLFDTYLDYMLAKFEPHRMVQNVQNLSFRTKNRVLLNPFLTNKELTPFCKTFP